MKITVVDGTEKERITYRIKEMFIEPFRGKAEIKEFYLPKDCPAFCSGCVSCTLHGEETCKDRSYISKIESALLEADLIIMTSPAYVMHATGQMKAFLDHLCYRWLPHRPAKEMFSKRALIITQCLGAGDKSTAKDIRDSLSWWGISEIKVFRAKLMGSIFWDELTEKKRSEIRRKITKLSKYFFSVDYSKKARTKLKTKVKFLFCREIQKRLHKNDPDYLDGKYWASQGWLDGSKPWK